MDEKKIRDYGERLSNLVSDYEEHIQSTIEKEYDRQTTKADKIADKVAKFGGSWTFIVIFSVFLATWIVVNALQLTKLIHFDEPPFILLNLILSFIAAFQAPIIMMSQNRQAKRDKQESIIDFSINYKAEQEIDDMQGHLHRLEADFSDFRTEIRNELTEIKNLLKSK
ncbi:DUF1003 domain-containing protein [Paenibacillus sp. SYP-B3998]|uniref:DUF1003 domain-containing protein n=1 Tax=Paenibacillus sp. SYP-B3998 TaxID=2678564 RepID=A0A6G3ZT15_9BACL|nr:DUF1003 domain-containing protein [Paenibacillus sp. SYP-B3998]NEW05356.1 DUF1003 domain-containing protein [Paenibacillus sp. SYP-B3998]